MYKPNIADSAFIAKGAAVYGNVTVKDNASIWYHTTVRSEKQPIVIGACSNIQDNAVVHVDLNYKVEIGDYVTVGHSAIVHGCTVGDNTLIGMGAIILNGAKVGKNCIIGAAALVTENAVIPDNSLVVGVPGKVIRTLNEEEIQHIRMNAEHYIEQKEIFANMEKEEC